MAAIDITGQRFGRLVAVSRVNRPHKEWRWLLRCDCGGATTTTVSKVRSGYTSSCGCLQREATSRAKAKHFQSNSGGLRPTTRLYRIWCNMRARCRDPKSNRWQYYGGKGISVCAEWDDFLAFEAWAKSAGYAPRLTIDRISGAGNYEPSNCRWATYSEQAYNKQR